MRTYVHTDIQTYRHTDIQTYRHTDIQTYRHTDIQTYRHTDIQTYRHTDIQTYRHTDIQTYRHTDIRTYGHTDRQTYRQTDRQTYRQTYRRQTERQPVHICIYTCMCVYLYITTYLHIYMYLWMCIYIYVYIHTYCESDDTKTTAVNADSLYPSPSSHAASLFHFKLRTNHVHANIPTVLLHPSAHSSWLASYGCTAYMVGSRLSERSLDTGRLSDAWRALRLELRKTSTQRARSGLTACLARC